MYRGTEDTDVFAEGIARGDCKAFNKLIAAMYPRLMAYACFVLDDSSAKDIVQDVFVYVWEHRKKIAGNGSLSSYMYKSCHSRIVDFLRRRHARGQVGSIDDIKTIELEWMASHSEQITEELSSRQLMVRLYGIMDELPEKRKDVVRMYYVNNLSADEISRILSMPKRTVEGHLYLGLKFLRKRASEIELSAEF